MVSAYADEICTHDQITLNLQGLDDIQHNGVTRHEAKAFNDRRETAHIWV